MDLIISAILSGLGKLGESIIKDSYEALKAMIKRKFGKDGKLTDAVEKLEENPTSAGRKLTLKEELEASKAYEDEEILQAAKALLEMIKALPGGQQIIQQTVNGNQNIFSATGDVKVSFSWTKEES